MPILQLLLRFTPSKPAALRTDLSPITVISKFLLQLVVTCFREGTFAMTTSSVPWGCLNEALSRPVAFLSTFVLLYVVHVIGEVVGALGFPKNRLYGRYKLLCNAEHWHVMRGADESYTHLDETSVSGKAKVLSYVQLNHGHAWWIFTASISHSHMTYMSLR